MNPPRILFVYQFLTLGGVEVVMQTRLREFARRNIEARALFLESYGGESLFEELAGQIAVCTDEVEIEQYLAEFNPDWISTIDTPAIIPIARRVVPNARIAYEVHTPYPASYAVLLDREVCDEVSGLIVPSPSQQDFISLRIARPLPIKVALNSIAADFSQRTPLSDSHPRPILMWVGRLDPLKNWRGFVELAARVRARTDAEFWLVGGLRSSIREQESLFDAVKQENLMDSFRWLPSVEYRDMQHLYSFVAHSGGCLVSTSWAESFGMAALEAMASRCPVFAPDIVGLRDVVKDGETGWLYPPGNTRRVCDLILESFENPTNRQRIIENAELTARKFTPESTVDQLLEIFAEWSSDVPPKTQRFLPERQGLITRMRVLAEGQKAAIPVEQPRFGSVSQKLIEQRQTIESLTQQSKEQQQVIQSLSQQSNEQQRVIESLSPLAKTVETLSLDLEAKRNLIAAREGALAYLDTENASLRDQIGEVEKQRAEDKQSLQTTVAELTGTQKALADSQAELDKITRSFGWRLLKLYGPIKYRYLLPLYRMLRLIPPSETKESKDQK